MSDRRDRPDRGNPDETISFSGRGIPPPPRSTAPLYAPGAPSGRRPQALIGLVLLLLGLAGGFALAQFLRADADPVPDGNLVLYENASSTFPIDGAQFTRSTYDTQKGKCDRELLKRYLREDKDHRFEAWLDLQEIAETEFDAFVDRLETKILSAPTPVTNYGCFPDGGGPCPFSVQSVLGAGTPVWFDPQQNRIVAKCACSNPVRSPKCPPNCEEVPTPTPSPTPSPTPTATPAPTRTPTPLTPRPTATPTRAPTPTPTPPASSSPSPVSTLTPGPP